jgi:hypothetical protein
MSRLPLLLLPLLTAAGLALADDPKPARSPAERLQQFRRERALVRRLVDGGLRLANEDDPLRRADQCNLLAGDLSREARQAVRERDRERGERFGLGLEKLLVRGVAGNLTLVADHPAPDGASLSEVHRLSDEALAVMEPLQKEFDRVPGAVQKQMKNVLRALTQGRAKLEEARQKLEEARHRAGKKPENRGK